MKYIISLNSKFCYIFISIQFMFPSFELLSNPIESVLPSQEGKVMDEFVYKLSWKGNWELDIPSEGDWIPEGSELPIAEILSITQSEKLADANPNLANTDDLESSLVLCVRFFVAGEFMLPISWRMNSESEWISSTLTFKIEPGIGEDEKEADVLPPVLFGDFLYSRLFLVILSIVGLVVALYYGFQYLQNKPVKAIEELKIEIPKEDIIEKKIRDILHGREFVSQKEVAYLITELIKTLANKKWSMNTFSHTDEELLSRLYKSTSIRKDEVEQFKHFLLASKYQFNTTEISVEEAKEIIKFWKGTLT